MPERGEDAGAVEVTGPDGRFVEVERGEGVVAWIPAAPGPAEVRSVEGPLARAAVNLDPAESDVRRGVSIAEARLASLDGQLQERWPLETWLLLAAAGALAAAAWAGGGRAEPT